MFRFTTFFMLLLFNLFAFATNTVDKENAETVAKSFATDHFSQSTNLDFDYLPIDVSEFRSIHLFKLEHGFILVSPSKTIYPVIAWSESNPFDNANIPEDVIRWLKSYLEIAQYCENNGISPAPAINKAWKELSDNSYQKKSTKDAVAPFTLTTWNQGCYYNSMLPVDSLSPSCAHVYTGCVATAMAQVMNYYHYPKNGNGSFGYNSNYGWIEADFENTTYDWASMEINLSAENPAVAELMAHAAISVSSQFFYNGTGAYDFDARDALVDYFDYATNAQFFWRSGYNGDWNDLLQNELQSGRPVIYGGVEQSTQFGHTFVLDGFQENFYHVNWGWGGQYNGYYLIDTLTPAGFHFDYQHDAIIGIEPDILQPCQLNGPENLTATVDQHAVQLTWNAPSGNELELLGYNVFRNDTLLNTGIITQTQFTDMTAPAGSHVYTLNAAFIGSAMGASATAEAYVSEVNNIAETGFDIYPNPASSEVMITFKNPFHEFSVRISDLKGSSLIYMEESLSGGKQFHLSIADLSPGIYILQIQSKNTLLTKKLVKQN